MQFRCGTMTQEEAEIIAKWHYSGSYSFYDMEADQDSSSAYLHAEHQWRQVRVRAHEIYARA